MLTIVWRTLNYGNFPYCHHTPNRHHTPILWKNRRHHHPGCTPLLDYSKRTSGRMGGWMDGRRWDKKNCLWVAGWLFVRAAHVGKAKLEPSSRTLRRGKHATRKATAKPTNNAVDICDLCDASPRKIQNSQPGNRDDKLEKKVLSHPFFTPC